MIDRCLAVLVLELGDDGETQCAHFPGNAPFAFGLGPTGPAFHALWRAPFATVLGWPRG